MKLSDLKTGESGMIVKVNGHGGFRKRIVEMGFIKGKMVESILNAPLNDPVKYNIMGYDVSLRHSEAELVEVVSKDDAKRWEDAHKEDPKGIPADDYELLKKVTEEYTKEISVAFVGNPNCGKTSIFNVASGAHERVGNYSGVTVDAKYGNFEMNGYKFKIVDLPGTYSLSAYSPEELYVRKHIIEKCPDVIVNVIDASNIERNLYLTSQLIDMDVPMIIALNMYDELIDSKNRLDIDLMGQLLGVHIVPTVGRTGEGVKHLFRDIINIYEGRQNLYKHIHVNHGQNIEKQIEKIEAVIRKNPEPHFNYSARFISIKMLENDKQIENDVVSKFDNTDEIIAERNKASKIIMEEMNEDSETAITDAKYGFVQGVLKECFVNAHVVNHNRIVTKFIDSVVTHKVWGYPIFLAMMFLMFFCTFKIGDYPMQWIDNFIAWIGGIVSEMMPDGYLKDLIVDGVIGGVGGVIVFLPNILILYLFISWMEDSGYMARAAFIMDRIMHKMGLHGKSFIPMIMGFGCNIPAIMATRTIEDRKSRLITMLIVPLMSCTARLPVYIIIINAFFPEHAVIIMFMLYLISIIMAIIMANLFSKYLIKGESSPFVMELPPYRMPTSKAIFRHTWEKGKQYLKKMGTTILLASIIIWALSYFPRYTDEELEALSTEQTIDANAESNEVNLHETAMKNSYLGKIGQAITPVIRPCGFEWREGVSIIAGTAAKEIVAATMGVLYSSSDSQAEEISDYEDDDMRLSAIIRKSGMTPISAFSFLIFVLLYMPCVPACIAIKHEASKTKWAFFTIAYTTVLAWICSTAVYQIGSLFL